MPATRTPDLDRARYLLQLQEQVSNRERAFWLATARPEQVTPDGNWNIWLILAGRGWGKTRTGAEDVADYARTHPKSRIAVVAPTFGDARDVCMEGESGLLNVVGDQHIAQWNRSIGELRLLNGSRIKTFSADEPDRLRGPQHHRAWADELAAWRYPEAFDQLVFGLRLGKHPRIVATTTPRPTKVIRELLERADVHTVRGSTFDNAANLSPAALDQLEARYGGTLLGRQELYGEVLTETPGAMWTQKEIEDHRVASAPEMAQIVIGVDPAGSSASGTVGIVAVGASQDFKPHPRTGQPSRHLYVLEDESLSGPPERWASTAVNLYHRLKADKIVAEPNYGGEMVAAVLRQVDPTVPIRMVHSSRGKRLRAEPIAALSAQGLFHLVGAYPRLEDEMTGWVEGATPWSPDRLDAMVFAATELLDHVRSRGGVHVPTGSRSNVSGTTTQAKTRITR